MASILPKVQILEDEQYVQQPTVSHLAAFTNNFKNLYSFFKEAQTFQGVYVALAGTTEMLDIAAVQLKNAVGICQIDFLIEKSQKTFQALIKWIEDPTKTTSQIELGKETLAFTTTAIKVYQFASKTFAFTFLQAYNPLFSVVKSSGELILGVHSLIESGEKILKIRHKLETTKTFVGDLAKSRDGKIHLAQLELNALEADYYKELMAIATKVCVIIFAALELVMMLYVDMAAAEVFFALGIILTVASHVGSYFDSIAEQTRKPYENVVRFDISSFQTQDSSV
jgi:hypothetical protein